MPWRLREQGRERRGGGWAPPSYTRFVINPLDNLRIRAVLQWAIIREHELWTGETPWNNNRGNVMWENNTGVRVTLEIPPRADQAPQNIPGAHPVPSQRADPLDRHKQELLNGVVEDKAPWLLFLLDIHYCSAAFPCSHLIFVQSVKIVKGTKSIHWNKCIAYAGGTWSIGMRIWDWKSKWRNLWHPHYLI